MMGDEVEGLVLVSVQVDLGEGEGANDDGNVVR